VTLESRQVLSHHHHQCFIDKVVAIIDVDEFVQKNVVPSTVVVDIIMTSYELSVDVPTWCRLIHKLLVCLRHDVCRCRSQNCRVFHVLHRCQKDFES
jgi:hypothetical protein